MFVTKKSSFEKHSFLTAVNFSERYFTFKKSMKYPILISEKTEHDNNILRFFHDWT